MKKKTQFRKLSIGEKITATGWVLTLVITVPIIMTLALGVVGMVIGGVSALIGLSKLAKYVEEVEVSE